MDQIVGIRVFCAVVELGSFVAAAERLEMSTSMISKHVSQLERRLGVRLLHRTSRRLSLTEVGRAYWETVRQVLEDLDEAESAVARESERPRGKLRLTAPVWFSNSRFAQVVCAFHRNYPDVSLDLDLSDRMVDIVEEGYDLALGVSSDLQTSLLNRQICSLRFHLVASPEFERGRKFEVLEDLRGCPTLDYTYAGWGSRVSGVEVNPVLRCNSTSMLHQAALTGLGMAWLPEWLVEEDLSQGRLRRLLPEISWPSPTLYAVCSSRRYLSARVQVFLAHLERLNR